MPDAAPTLGPVTHGDARIALKRRDHGAAKVVLQEALHKNPDDAEGLCLLSLAYWRGFGDTDSASAYLQLARSLRPADARILTLSASLCLHRGDLDAASSFARQAMAVDALHAPAYVVLARTHASSIDDDHLRQMLMLSRRTDTRPQRLRPLHNAIGRVFDARGEFDAAFHHFSLSNLHAKGLYIPAVRDERLAQARSFFTPQFFDRHRGSGIAGAGCVFVIGMPRSGSTLLEQMLCAHPQIDTCNESDALGHIEATWTRFNRPHGPRSGLFEHYRHVDSTQAARAAAAYLNATSLQMRKRAPRRCVDKRLSNYLFLPLVRLMFQDATVLHTHRHPIDVCLSCFTQGFDGHHYANDLTNLAHYYLNYQGYMRLWTELFPGVVQHCRYEDLVADFESQSRRLVHAIGLDWNDNCAKPHAARRSVSTASAAQVRQPVHQGRVERWRAYEKHLKPLIDRLGGFASIERLQGEFV